MIWTEAIRVSDLTLTETRYSFDGTTRATHFKVSAPWMPNGCLSLAKIVSHPSGYAIHLTLTMPIYYHVLEHGEKAYQSVEEVYQRLGELRDRMYRIASPRTRLIDLEE